MIDTEISWFQFFWVPGFGYVISLQTLSNHIFWDNAYCFYTMNSLKFMVEHEC